MNTEILVAKFKHFLEQEAIVVPSNDVEIDLYHFFTVLTELKTETKRTSKQLHASFTQFKDAFLLMESQVKSQDEMRVSLTVHHNADIARMGKAHVLELIDLRDRTERSINQSVQVLQGLKSRWFNHKVERKIDNLLQGMQINVDHLDHCLQKKGVEKIETLGVIFNPKVMTITDVMFNKDLNYMQVLEEIVSGYRAKDGYILRYAEVIVNKDEGVK